MDRVYFRLPDVTFERSWTFGPVRFLSEPDLRIALVDALGRPPTNEGMRVHQELAADQLAAWGNDAALEVTTDDDGAADRIAEEAMAVLRFYMRPLVRVNVESHRIGLVGEHAAGIRDRLILWDHDQPLVGAGWSRVGGTSNFHFTSADVEVFEKDPSLAALALELDSPSTSRSDLGRRALVALAVHDQGFRSRNPSLRILSAAIAVEVLYSRGDVDLSKPQTLAIARRVAYLTCGAGCGRREPHCPYTERAPGSKALLADLESMSLGGMGWQCSAFLHIAAPADVQYALRYPPLFTARNVIAHEGALDSTDRQLRHWVGVADGAIAAALDWFARNPGQTMIDLDDLIGGQPPDEQTLG